MKSSPYIKKDPITTDWGIATEWEGRDTLCEKKGALKVIRSHLHFISVVGCMDITAGQVKNAIPHVHMKKRFNHGN